MHLSVFFISICVTMFKISFFFVFLMFENRSLENGFNYYKLIQLIPWDCGIPQGNTLGPISFNSYILICF